MKPDLVLCLGNEILSDDGFGAVVAGRLAVTDHGKAEVIFAPVAGFALLDLLDNRKRVLIVDTIQTGKFPPGTIHRFTVATLAHSNHLINSHQISLPTAIELGKRLGMNMPADIDIVAVEAHDVYTVREGLSPAVSAAVDHAVIDIQGWISGKEKVSNGKNGKAAKGLAVGSA